MVGEWDVDGLMRRIPSRLLSEWMAYAQVEPFGPMEDEYRTGLLASVMANTVRREEDKAFEVTDFMRIWDIDAEEKPGLTEKLTFAATMFGAEVPEQFWKDLKGQA
jgi:hypothetical protein